MSSGKVLLTSGIKDVLKKLTYAENKPRKEQQYVLSQHGRLNDSVRNDRSDNGRAHTDGRSKGQG